MEDPNQSKWNESSSISVDDSIINKIVSQVIAGDKALNRAMSKAGHGGTKMDDHGLFHPKAKLCTNLNISEINRRMQTSQWNITQPNRSNYHRGTQSAQGL